MIMMNIIKESMAKVAKGKAHWRRGKGFSGHGRARLLLASLDKWLQVQRLPEPPYQPRRCLVWGWGMGRDAPSSSSGRREPLKGRKPRGRRKH